MLEQMQTAGQVYPVHSVKELQLQWRSCRVGARFGPADDAVGEG